MTRAYYQPAVAAPPAVRAGMAGLGPYRGETYYGIPPIKHSHYEWRTALAFFCNGVAGGSQILATVLDLLGRDDERGVVRAGRYLALAGSSASTALLVNALHTPVRWYNMLRIFKRTSPMSIGIWSITPFTVLSGLSAAAGPTESESGNRVPRALGRIFGVPAALLGTIVMTYMGTEIEETTTPLWASAHPLLAPFYAAVGMSNSAAALRLAAGGGRAPGRTRRLLDGLALGFGAVDLALGSLVLRRWTRLPEAAAFARTRYAPLLRTILALGAADLVELVRGWGPDSPTPLARAAAVGKLAGGVALQGVLIYGGMESGRHARDSFEYAQARPGPEWEKESPARRAALSARRRRGPDAPRRTNPAAVLLGIGALAIGAFLFTRPRKEIDRNGNARPEGRRVQGPARDLPRSHVPPGTGHGAPVRRARK